MITLKTTVTSFLKEKFGVLSKGEKRALFEREASTLFKEYRKWHQDNFYGKSPSGVKLVLFRKWLIENDCFFVTKKR